MFMYSFSCVLINSSSDILLAVSNTAAILHMMANVYNRDNIISDKSIQTFRIILIRIKRLSIEITIPK